MKVLVPEPEHAGHYLQWLAYVVDAFAARGDAVAVVTSAGARASAEWQEYLAPRAGAFECHVIPYMADTPARWRSRTKRMRYAVALAAAERHIRPDLVFVPFLDTLMLPLALLEALHAPCLVAPAVEGVLQRIEDAYPDSVRPGLHRITIWAQHRLFAARRLRRVLCVDDLGLPHVQARAAGRTCVEHCPQPVRLVEATGAGVRRQYDLAPDVVVLGSFGLQDERKGVDRLLRAFLHRPPDRRERVLLVGKQSSGVRAILADAGARDRDVGWRILALDRFATVDEYGAALAATDVVAAVHPRHVGTSDTLLHAVAADKPVLASQYGWIGHFARTHALGWVGNVESPAALAAGLDWAFARPVADPAVTRPLAARHTVEHFHTVVRGEA